MNRVAARRRAAELDDAALLLAIGDDDLSALGELYDRHARAVFRVVYRVAARSGDADDIVHATFLTVPRIAAKFDGRESARSWLIGIAVRTALRHNRSVARFARMLARAVFFADRLDAVSPEDTAMGRADVAALEHAVARLPPAQRAVFILIEAEGWSHAEVATELGIPLATVRTRLFHAKRVLSEAVRREVAR